MHPHHSPYTTTVRDLGTALRLSTMVTPRKSALLTLIDDAIRECRNERRNASTPGRFNDVCDALDKLHEARSLAAGGQS